MKSSFKKHTQRVLIFLFLLWDHEIQKLCPDFSANAKQTTTKLAQTMQLPVKISALCQKFTTDYELTCNLNTVLVVWIHLAQFIQFFLGDDRDITPVANVLSLLQLNVNFNIFKKVFQVMYRQTLPQIVHTRDTRHSCKNKN